MENRKIQEREREREKLTECQAGTIHIMYNGSDWVFRLLWQSCRIVSKFGMRKDWNDAEVSFYVSLSSPKKKFQHTRTGTMNRVSEQLQLFYGPLLACVTCSKSAFDAMCNVHSPDGSKAGFFLAKSQDPNSEQGKAYRMWTKQVFMPLNERVARLIIDRSDLIVGDKFEPLLLQLVAHVSAMRVMVKRWDEGDLTAITSIGYPDEIHNWIEDAFANLKATQAKFLALNGESKQDKSTDNEKSTLASLGETLDRAVTNLLYSTSKL